MKTPVLIPLDDGHLALGVNPDDGRIVLAVETAKRRVFTVMLDRDMARGLATDILTALDQSSGDDDRRARG